MSSSASSETVVASAAHIENDILEEEEKKEYDEEQKAAETIIKIINKIKNDFEKEYNEHKEDYSMLQTLHKKYSPFKYKNGKLQNPCLHEIVKSDSLSKYFQGEGIQQIVVKMYRYTIKKIKGIYKHAQALKTGYCNLKIIEGFTQPNTISLCITKNNLEANEQWLQRLFKELDHRFPVSKVKDKILVISSKKETLGGNATHCQNMMAAWNILKKKNNIKVIFFCSNQKRISDILEMSLDFQNITHELQKNLIIFHDEGHNSKEGIPAYRNIIEHIVIQPNVLSFTPISASNNSIFDLVNPIWKKDNLEKQALNYIKFDDTMSSDSKFSSCNDAVKVSFETLRNKPSWQNYNVKNVSSELYNSTYNTHNSDQSITEIKRNLDYCSFLKNDREIEAVNNGLNCLNMNELLEKDDFYNTNEFNLHIISTPRRNIITKLLCLEAIKKEYNPIVLGIYGSKYHLFHDNRESDVTQLMGNGEFNVKLERLINTLKQKGICINRPFIVIGNYSPTGESLTFVNVNYGTVKSAIRLISTTPEEDYQMASRENYMCTKFLERDPNWVMSEKYLIGDQMFIDNAMSYEAENDARILRLRQDQQCENKNNAIDNIQLSSSETSLADCSLHNVAVPIRFAIDRSDPIVKKMLAIAEKLKRTEDEKAEFLRLLKKYIDSGECDFTDVTRKFDFNKIKVTGGFRSYRKNEEKEENEKYKEKEKNWRFRSYKNHFEAKTPFINNNNAIKQNECEILTCIDTFIIKDTNGNESFKNLKSVWWIGYKY
jgi:hypothetical protein